MELSDHGQYSGVVDIARNGIDEVIRLQTQAKQDEALIRQLVEALEDFDDAGPPGEGWKSDRLLSLLASARARLEEKPCAYRTTQL